MQKFPLDSYAYSLARIRWDVFGTLTFRSVPSPKKAYGRAWALMRLTAELVQRPYSQLLIALCAERGELTGRFHLHFLPGGTQMRDEITLVSQLEHLWYMRNILTNIRQSYAYPPKEDTGLMAEMVRHRTAWQRCAKEECGSKVPQQRACSRLLQRYCIEP